ncbi:MAG: hypothetical protein QOF56_4439 [Acidobacteriaceae bacterium]|jgi:hypothetical protein|nr:hypothetical protein [Acidobacteriaceae bacterium]
MPITRLLSESSLSLEPDDIRRLKKAYNRALRSLSLVDRNDPLTELIAKKIVEIRKAGVTDPNEIYKMAIKALGIP